MTFRKEIVEKGGSGISDMEKSGWGRSEAYSNIWNHLIPSIVFRTDVAREGSIISDCQLPICDSEKIENRKSQIEN
jgi:hypothetical protein